VGYKRKKPCRRKRRKVRFARPIPFTAQARSGAQLKGRRSFKKETQKNEEKGENPKAPLLGIGQPQGKWVTGTGGGEGGHQNENKAAARKHRAGPRSRCGRRSATFEGPEEGPKATKR